MDPMSPFTHQVAEFLMYLFREGKQVSTIRNYRSFISAVNTGFPVGYLRVPTQSLTNSFEGCCIGSLTRRLKPSWSINGVFHMLSFPMYEPVYYVLVAAASTHHSREVHALTTKEGYLRFNRSGVRMLPGPFFRTKNKWVASVHSSRVLPPIHRHPPISTGKIG